jgi:hypothetical protein
LKRYLVATLALLVLAGVGLAREHELAVSVDSGGSGAVALPSRHITVSPMPLSEEELYNDNGSAYYHWSGGIAGFASKFIAPYDCYVVAVRLTCFNSSGRNFYIDILGEDPGVPGKPNRDDSLLGGYETFWEDPHSGDTWVRFDLDTNPLLSTGDVFFPMSDDSIDGLDNAPQDNQAPGPDDSAWWYYGGSSWGDLDFFGAMLIRVYVDDDMDAPYSANQDPAPDETDVPIDADISFDIVDDDKGVDGDTIVVEVDGTDVTGDCDITDNGDGSFSVLYDPADDFGYEQTVEVYWSAADGLGNAGEDSWSFETEPEPNVVSTTWGQIKADF